MMWSAAAVRPPLRRKSGGMAAALQIALFVASANAMTTSDYVATLEAIRNADAAGARGLAQQLLGADVESPQGHFTADDALLHEVMANPTAARVHLDATITALHATKTTTSAKTDPRLLERLRAEETAARMKAGGEVRLIPTDEKSVEKAAGTLGKVWEWIGRQFEKLANWWDRWWPKESLKEKEAKNPPVVRSKWIVTIVAILIVLVLGVLAVEVVRRSRASGPEEEIVTSDAIQSRRDEDPLSRGANEWERYAAQLAAAGRTREAIRAWFHAVLVTLYAAGILHFKKGRTNWEYIAALSPDLGWRGELVTMTRRFEKEWYGHAQSTIEALDDASECARRILEAVRRRAAA